ncbi:hypothetical protein T01_13255 [Trichinella spiralis]|uniref:Uncharacterized protein n=1 Tax=Trichinella spiralis TaxID=6334 RepID=A0A0V1AID7_TRISP|nr:hypothetical protein T01_13255 [Trichinella spiralis]
MAKAIFEKLLFRWLVGWFIGYFLVGQLVDRSVGRRSADQLFSAFVSRFSYKLLPLFQL